MPAQGRDNAFTLRPRARGLPGLGGRGDENQSSKGKSSRHRVATPSLLQLSCPDLI